MRRTAITLTFVVDGSPGGNRAHLARGSPVGMLHDQGMDVREIELRLPPGIDDSSVEEAVERVCREFGLRIGMRGTLASYPESRHWHLKRDGERGTLEITFAPRSARLWLAVHVNRGAFWINEECQSLAEQIEGALEQEKAGP